MIFVGVGLTLAGCGTKKAEQTAPHPVYGVADLETLVKSHPKYSEYFRLETEYSHLVEKYKNEQQRIIRVASQQSKIRASVQDQSDRLAAENELKIRVKTKEDELNRKIQDLYSELSEKYKEKGVFSVDNLTAEERARMANLQMKLTVLGVRGDEKEQIKKELHELLSSRAFQGGYPMNGWLPEDVEKMNSAREKGSAELEKYADEQAAEIKADLDKKRAETMKTIGAEGILAAPEEFNAEWKVFSVDNLTAEERARMANLQMKLTVLGVRGDEKEQIKKELHELLSSRAFQGGYPMNGWLPEDVEKMNSAREKGSAELEKYADEQAAEIKADLDKKRAETMKTIGAEGILAAPEEFNAEWKDRMEAKQKEIAALKEKMMEDIRREAGRVASEKHLTMIFTQYRANISAEDVTGDIAGKIIAMGKQEDK